MSAKILGPDLVMTKTALYAQLVEQATADNQAAPTKYSVWPAKSGGLMLCLILKRLEGAGKARVRQECPALHSTMGNQDTPVL